MQEYKVSVDHPTEARDLVSCRQNKLETQYTTKREAHLREVQDLRQQLEAKSNEIRSLTGNVTELKNLNEELKVRKLTEFFVIICSDRPRLASICCDVSRH